MARRLVGIILAAWMATSMGTAARAQEPNEALRQRIDALEKQIQELKRTQTEIKEQRQEPPQRKATTNRDGAGKTDNLGAFKITGYAATGFKLSDAEDVDSTFTGLQFNPIFLYRYGDALMFEGELEFELEDDGETEIDLEFANVNYLIADGLTLIAGKFLSPLGQFQERLHPAWINKLPDRPAGFNRKGGGLPGTDLGLMARGGFGVGPATINYSVFIGNGPQLKYTDGALDYIDLKGFGEDDNGNKAIGGRIGVLPIRGLEIGASILSSKIEGKKDDGVSGDVTEGDYLWWGLDASYSRGELDLRVEYFQSTLDAFQSQAAVGSPTVTIPSTDWKGWYVQAAYRLSGVTDARILKNLEPVIRYGEFDVDGFSGFVASGAPEKRLTLGVDYLIAPSIIAKAAVSRRKFTEPDTEDATEFTAQIAYGF